LLDDGFPADALKQTLERALGADLGAVLRLAKTFP
jgi:hypothetical protein